MPTAVIAGASIAGLASALALHGLGYRIVILERSAPPPEGPLLAIVSEWHRTWVPQAVHSHTLTSLGVRVLRERAPHVLSELLASGARLLDLTQELPAGLSDRTRKDGDDELVALACRRTTLELVLYRYIRGLRAIEVRHGTSAVGLLLDGPGRHVRAATTDGGAIIPADIVVDATGMRGAARSWLGDTASRTEKDQIQPSGLSGFTRFFRRTTDDLAGPLGRGNAAGDIFDHYAGVLHPGDNRTFSIAFAVLPHDPISAGLRDPNAFLALSRATPGLARWLDGADPISPVHSITSPPNVLRGAAISRRHRVAGLFPVGDAACITNPLFGRGMSLAFAHAFCLGDLLAALPVPDEEQSDAFARMTDNLLRPWYEHSVSADRERIIRWQAAANDTCADSQPISDPVDPPARATLTEVAAAARTSGIAWRGLMRVLMSLATPEQVFDESFTVLVRKTPPVTVASRTAAPDRAQLARLITSATAVSR